MTTTNSKEQASTFFERIRNAMAIYIEELMEESDDENTRLRGHVNEQNKLLGKRMKALNDEANALQESRKQASGWIHENGLLREQNRTLLDSKKDWVDRLVKQQQEVYELREIIVILEGKTRLYENVDGSPRDKNLALQYTVDDLRKTIAALREEIRINEDDCCVSCFPKGKINELKDKIKRLEESLRISEQKRLDLNRSFQNFLLEIKRLEKELSEVREIAFGYRET